MTNYKFTKACAFGNDFVITYGKEIARNHIIKISDRRNGVGCDQVILIDERDKIPYLRFFNGDGSESKACGNGTLCVASTLSTKKIQTPQRIIECEFEGDNVSINLGSVKVFDINLPLREIRENPIGADIGNPHAIYCVENIQEHDLKTLGPIVEKHPIFPNRTNVELVKIIDKQTIELSIWERGAGITPACGSGATATFAALNSKNLVSDMANVIMPGGNVAVRKENNEYWLTGKGKTTFEGSIKI